MALKFYVISLVRQQERRQKMAQMLDSFGVDYEFFDAVDGRNLSEEDAKLCDLGDQHILTMRGGRRALVEDALSPSEVGCALSHLKLYQHILDQGDEQAVILEDDTKILPEAMQALQNINCITEPWDVINFSDNSGIRNRLGARKYYFDRENGRYFQRTGMRNPTLDAIFNRRRVMFCAAFFVINRHACERLIELGYPVRIVADYLLGMIGYNELRTFRVFPLGDYFTFHETESTIGNRPRHHIVRLK